MNNSSIQTGIQAVMDLLKNTPYTIAPKKKNRKVLHLKKVTEVAFVLVSQ